MKTLSQAISAGLTGITLTIVAWGGGTSWLNQSALTKTPASDSLVNSSFIRGEPRPPTSTRIRTTPGRSCPLLCGYPTCTSNGTPILYYIHPCRAQEIKEQKERERSRYNSYNTPVYSGYDYAY
jgi:hypothetical protein